MPGCLSGIAWDYFTTSLLVRLRTSLPEPTTGGLDPCAGLEKTNRQKRGGLVGALGKRGAKLTRDGTLFVRSANVWVAATATATAAVAYY